MISVFIFNLSGCVSMQGGRSLKPQRLEPSAIIRFSDVPVPVGFKLISDRSFILESGGVRAGVLRYTGKANIEDVIRFYKRQMPIYNWALLNVLEYGEHMLNFERENESCLITIETKWRRINISVSLAPKSPILEPQRVKEGQESQDPQPDTQQRK
jgi:hypothetical protein